VSTPSREEVRIDRIEDFQTMVNIARFAEDHWPKEIVQQLSYITRRMSSEIKKADNPTEGES